MDKKNLVTIVHPSTLGHGVGCWLRASCYLPYLEEFNMASILPPIPRFVFTVFEPIALVAGYLSPMLDVSGFVNSQLPPASVTTISSTATERILALQLGNVYGLLAMIGVGLLYATSEAKVVRNFLLACAIADVGHLYVTYLVMYAPVLSNLQKCLGSL